MLAIDADQRIVGADRAARSSFLLDDQKLQNGASLWSLFKRNANLSRVRHSGDFFLKLAALDGEEMRSALTTPPCNPRASLILHARPRLDLLEHAWDLAYEARSNVI